MSCQSKEISSDNTEDIGGNEKMTKVEWHEDIEEEMPDKQTEDSKDKTVFQCAGNFPTSH